MDVIEFAPSFSMYVRKEREGRCGGRIARWRLSSWLVGAAYHHREVSLVGTGDADCREPSPPLGTKAPMSSARVHGARWCAGRLMARAGPRRKSCLESHTQSAMRPRDLGRPRTNVASSGGWMQEARQEGYNYLKDSFSFLCWHMVNSALDIK